MAGDFFITGNGNTALSSLDDFDPSNKGNVILGDATDGGVLDEMDIPRNVSFGPSGGRGTGSRTPAPFSIPLDAACTFCLGDDGRGAIAFDTQGHATFWAEDGRSPLSDTDFLSGASVSLMADDVPEMRTLVIAAPTGALRTLSLELP
jgi:hypothetical protein